MKSASPPDAALARLVASPACIPQMTLDEILPAFAALGFTKFEAFTQWATSGLDTHRDPVDYVAHAGEHGLRFTSMHLPPIVADDRDATLDTAVHGARFAQRLGASVVLFKADSRETYVDVARPFLDRLDAEHIDVTPVLQNHKGTPITSLDDFRTVIDGIDDPRMKTLLEVGHFQRAGVAWREGYDLLGDSIALVHVNDIDAAGASVPFGSGEVDFAGLLAQLAADGYAGEIVVELELDTRATDPQRTLRELGRAIEHLRQSGLEELA